jgi:O-antigen/teichoic acid export membrane protein
MIKSEVKGHVIEKSIKKNFLYNLILTTVNMLFPLITAPYLSAVLGAENIGKVNYATAITSWFILFASFGIPRYGVREIARNRDDKKMLSMTFWNLIFIQLVLSILAIVAYIIVIFNISIFSREIKLYLLMNIMIILSIFSIDWFYQGIEEYGYITVRNAIFKIVSIILIFTMIKDRQNYLFYAAINVFGLSFNNILNYIHAKRYIDKKIYKFKTAHYLKELRIYFLTTLIIAVYTTLDQVLIGVHSEEDLAYYVRSKSIQSVGMNITNSIITVFIPRTAYLINTNYERYKRAIQQSINYIYILALPCIVGIFFLSREITKLFGGNEFMPAAPALMIISILILINSIGSWQINQILIPHKFEGLAFKVQSAGAVISFCLNIILIYKFSYIGASITWVLTETFLAIFSAILIKKRCKEIKIKYLNKSLIKYFISAFFMAIAILLIKFIIKDHIWVIVYSLLLTPIVYFGIVIILKDEVLLGMVVNVKNRS